MTERPKILTPDDIAAVAEASRDAFKNEVTRLFESIGYDVTTPDARASIREDHVWVRDFRHGAAKVKTGVTIAGISSVVSGLLWAVFHFR